MNYPEYGIDHARVRRERGRAKDLMCEEGGDHPAYEWAYIHDSDPSDPMNYRALCRSHHRQYDYVMIPDELKERRIKAMSAVKRDRSFTKTPEYRAMMSEKMKGVNVGRKRTPEQKERIRQAALARHRRERGEE